MKRDMDLIRRIALATTDLGEGETLQQLDGVEERTFVMHVQWMAEADLVHAALAPAEGRAPANFAAVLRLTWDGCEFADAAVSDTLWAKAKEKVIKPGTSFTFDLLKEWLKAELSQGFPSIRSLGS